ncbi:MAG: hypothetical protein EOM78_12720, partial [Erysipelotrichia bacterium]|nr:hypothetical protein [Erysipelotrichia bacterium]
RSEFDEKVKSEFDQRSNEENVFKFFHKYHVKGLLNRVDITTMLASVEARVPFLDHELVEFSYKNIPYDLKLRWKTNELKEESKKELSIVLKKYLNTLVGDKDMRKFIESITIEGHTNSDGSYLSNLALSQQRALAVMQFLYDSNIIDKDLLSTYVNSSGRSSSDLILDKNGAEDKDASRRIEIKFSIKNEEAVKELQNFLGKEK